MIDATSLERMATRCQALGDPLRLRIILVLQAGPHCVCEIQSAIGPVAPNLLSYHLGILRHAGLVTATRRGRLWDYRLEPTALAALQAFLATAAAAATETVPSGAQGRASPGGPPLTCTSSRGAGRS